MPSACRSTASPDTRLLSRSPQPARSAFAPAYGDRGSPRCRRSAASVWWGRPASSPAKEPEARRPSGSTASAVIQWSWPSSRAVSTPPALADIRRVQVVGATILTPKARLLTSLTAASALLPDSAPAPIMKLLCGSCRSYSRPNWIACPHDRSEPPRSDRHSPRRLGGSPWASGGASDRWRSATTTSDPRKERPCGACRRGL